jgi:hypothetical protein
MGYPCISSGTTLCDTLAFRGTLLQDNHVSPVRKNLMHVHRSRRPLSKFWVIGSVGSRTFRGIVIDDVSQYFVIAQFWQCTFMYPNHYLHVYIGDQEGVSYTCLNESDSSANSLSFCFSSKKSTRYTKYFSCNRSYPADCCSYRAHTHCGVVQVKGPYSLWSDAAARSRAHTHCRVVQVKGPHSLWSGAGQGPTLTVEWCRSRAHTRSGVMQVKSPYSLWSGAGQGPTLAVK